MSEVKTVCLYYVYAIINSSCLYENILTITSYDFCCRYSINFVLQVLDFLKGRGVSACVIANFQKEKVMIYFLNYVNNIWELQLELFLKVINFASAMYA